MRRTFFQMVAVLLFAIASGAQAQGAYSARPGEISDATPFTSSHRDMSTGGSKRERDSDKVNATSTRLSKSPSPSSI